MSRTRTYGLDIDTIRFAQRVRQGSGVTILPNPLKDINKFVIGVKRLGLWNNIIFWPMRNIHNAGSGSAIYSLGGQGIINGSLTNSPTWGYEGIGIDASLSQSIDFTGTPFTDFVNGHSIFSVFRPTGPNPQASTSTEQWSLQNNGSLVTVGARGTGNTNGFLIDYRTPTLRYSASGTNYTTHKDLFGIYFWNSFSKNNKYKSANQAFTGGGANASTNSYSGSLKLTATLGGRNISTFFLVTTSNFDWSVNESLIEKLFKQTLGKGLNLP
jgi:hypothetical protein